MENIESLPMLTLHEMRLRYDREWVLIVDYQSDPVANEDIEGRVLAKSVDMRVVERSDLEPKSERAAYYDFGDVGAGTVLLR